MILDTWWIMGWEEYSLNSHIFPMAVQAIFEGVNWLCVDNLLCKPIPMTHHSVTEKIFSGIQTTSVDWKSITVSSKMVSSVAKLKKLLLIHLLYICQWDLLWFFFSQASVVSNDRADTHSSTSWRTAKSTLVPFMINILWLMTSSRPAGPGGEAPAMRRCLVCEHVTKQRVCEIMICRWPGWLSTPAWAEKALVLIYSYAVRYSVAMLLESSRFVCEYDKTVSIATAHNRRYQSLCQNIIICCWPALYAAVSRLRARDKVSSLWNNDMSVT